MIFFELTAISFQLSAFSMLLHMYGALFVVGLLSMDTWFNKRPLWFRFALYTFALIAWPFLLGRFIRIQLYKKVRNSS